jgi:hypothetical protein
MRTITLALVLAAAASAAAQTQDATPTQPPAERKPLNLKLDEPVSSQPRISFGAPDSKGEKQEKQPADTLPSLGGAPNRSYERPLSPDTPGSPFPKDTNPNL